jgi:hypothetical protein
MNDTIMSPRPESFGIMNNMEIAEEQAVIIPMEAASVQRIVAGQAITDLASAVKELVDNALDAGAKVINSKSTSDQFAPYESIFDWMQFINSCVFVVFLSKIELQSVSSIKASISLRYRMMVAAYLSSQGPTWQ